MALQLRIQIKGITKPPVWRRLLIPDTFTFRQLHFAIQLAFDWGCCHLYQFQKQAYNQGWRISEPDDDDFLITRDTILEGETNVLQFIKQHNLQRFIYVYDFGDSWEHEIMVEDINSDEILLPVCLDGKGKTPPEDCGGCWGYEMLKEMKSSKRKTPEERERLELAFSDWDVLSDEQLSDDGLTNDDAKPDKYGWQVFSINEFNLKHINRDLKDFKQYEQDMSNMWQY